MVWKTLSLQGCAQFSFFVHKSLIQPLKRRPSKRSKHACYCGTTTIIFSKKASRHSDIHWPSWNHALFIRSLKYSKVRDDITIPPLTQNTVLQHGSRCTLLHYRPLTLVKTPFSEAPVYKLMLTSPEGPIATSLKTADAIGELFSAHPLQLCPLNSRCREVPLHQTKIGRSRSPILI